MDDDNQLPEDWSPRDSIAVFYEYVALCRAQWLVGVRDLPPLLQPRPSLE